MQATAQVTQTWRDYWDSHAGELGGEPPRYLSQALVQTLRPASGQRILEAGCGTGGLALQVAALGAHVTALDIVPQCVRGAANQGLTGVVGDLFHLPFADGVFDAVYNSGVMEHFDDTTLAAGLAEMARVVRPGGKLVCIVPSATGRFYTWGKSRLERAGQWRYGRETPQTSLVVPMTAAGLVGGREWRLGVRWQVRFLTGWRRKFARLLVAPFAETSALGAALWGAYLLVSDWRKPEKAK